MVDLKFFKCILLLPFLFQSLWLHSNCAVGGELRYSCIGGNNFEIEVIVYIDCYVSCPTVSIPPKLPVNFFTSGNFPANNVGSNGQIHLDKIEEFSLTDTTHQERECGFLPKSVCVNAVLYRGTVSLPFRFGGYYLASEWSRRKVMITNMRQSTPNGPIFTARISQNSLNGCYSGGRFREWDRLYFCLDEEIYYDHSIINSDADSFVYSFYHPFFTTWPDPPFNPLRFEDGFSVNNLMGGDDPLRIDRNTGIITGTPDQAGSFIIGVSAREYLNNQLIATTYRDILFFAGNCGRANADFEVEDLYCFDRRIEIEHYNENFISNRWVIGNLDDPIRVTTSDNGTIIFPDFGEFEYTRIAFGPHDGCHDTVTQTIIIKDEEVGIFAEIERDSCTSDTLDVLVNVKSTYLPLDSIDFELRIRQGNESEVTSSAEYQFSISGFPIFIITVNVLNPEICAESFVNVYPTGFIFNDGFTRDYFICDGEVILDEHCDLRNELIDLNWDPEPFDIIEQDFPYDCIIPVVAPDTSTLYVGTLTLEDCIGHFYYNIGVYKEGDKFLQDTFCGRIIQIEENPFSGFANQYNWRFLQNDIVVGTRIGEFPQMTFPSFGDAMVELRPFQLNGINCPDTIRQEIFLFEPSVEWEIDLFTLNCIDSLTVRISGEQTGLVLGEEEYVFIKEGQDTIISQNAEFEFTTGLTDRIEFTLIVKTDRGCFIEESFNLETPYNPDLTGSESFSICFGDTLVLEYPTLDGLDFNWVDTIGFLSEIDELPALVSPDSSFQYELLTSLNGCDFSFTFDVQVNYIDEIDLNSFWYCDNVLEREFDFNEIFGADISEWRIFDKDGQLVESGEDNFTNIEFPEIGDYIVELFSDTQGGCGKSAVGFIHFIDTTTVILDIDLLEKECVGNEVFLKIGSTFMLSETVEDEFDVNWIVATSSYDSIVIADDTLQIRLDGITNFDVILRSEGFTDCVFKEVLKFDFDLIEIPGRGDSLEVCLGDTLSLFPAAPLDFEYVWSPALGFISSLTEPDPLVSPNQSALYSASINSANCSAEHLVYVEVISGPVIESVSADPPVLSEAGESFLNANISGDLTSILWSPAEFLDDPSVSNPIASIEETTSFVVEVIDAFGCVDSAEITIFFEQRPCAPPFVFLPNAFSPNGDGVNDVLYVRGEGVLNMELWIYNRFGQQVFYSDDQSRGWNGDFRGEDMPPGVYAYHLVVECTNGEVNELSGNINLIR